MRKTIKNRLSYLYTGELVSLILFVPVSYLLNLAYPNLHLYALSSFWISFLLLELLLMQGAFYWYAKYNQLKQEGTFVTPTPVVSRLKRLEKLNIAFIILGPFLFVLDFVIWSPSYPVFGLAIAAFIYLFALLEYINYFHMQLSYDNLSDLATLRRTKKLKPSSMRKDFRRMK